MTKITKTEMLETLKNKYPSIVNITGHDGWRNKDDDLKQPSVFVTVKLMDHVYRNPCFTSKMDVISAYTTENLEMIKQEFPATLKELKKEAKEYLKSKEGKRFLLTEKIKEYAKSTAVDQDEHGIYQRNDSITIYVNEAVDNKKEMKKYFASGEFIALVTVNRSRTYSKQYTRNFGTGDRSDKYIIGTNETGSRFAHQVPDSVKTLSDAIKWIWQDQEIIARHGDIAITPSKTIKNKTGEHVENTQIIDSHVFTGEMAKNGSIYVRNGVIKHQKNQHPDVVVGSDWCKVVIAKRYRKGMVGTRD